MFPELCNVCQADEKVWVFWWSKKKTIWCNKTWLLYSVFMETIANLKNTFGIKAQGWICTKLLDVSCTYACWLMRKWNAAPLFLTSHGPAFAPSVLQAANRLVFVSCDKQMFAENVIQENRPQDLMYFTATIDRTAASLGFTWQAGCVSKKLHSWNCCLIAGVQKWSNSRAPNGCFWSLKK